jgi:hypothetical protein
MYWKLRRRCVVYRKLAIAAWVTLAGCSEASRVQSSPEAGVDAGPGGTPGCGAERLEPGDHLIGAPRTRQYIVHVAEPSVARLRG